MRAPFRRKRRLIQLLAVGITAAGLPLIAASPAHASGCTFPPCGQVINHTSSAIDVRWNNGDGAGWHYGWVNAGGTMGGYFNDRLDIDALWIPSHTCFDISGWPLGQSGGSGGRWFVIHSYETASVNRGYGC